MGDRLSEPHPFVTDITVIAVFQSNERRMLQLHSNDTIQDLLKIITDLPETQQYKDNHQCFVVHRGVVLQEDEKFSNIDDLSEFVLYIVFKKYSDIFNASSNGVNVYNFDGNDDLPFQNFQQEPVGFFNFLNFRFMNQPPGMYRNHNFQQFPNTNNNNNNNFGADNDDRNPLLHNFDDEQDGGDNDIVQVRRNVSIVTKVIFFLLGAILGNPSLLVLVLLCGLPPTLIIPLVIGIFCNIVWKIGGLIMFFFK